MNHPRIGQSWRIDPDEIANRRQKMGIKCGVYIVPERVTVHKADFECAAWWQDITLEAGPYPVFADMRGGTLWFSVEIPGIIAADYFQSLVCGRAIGAAYDTAKNAGQTTSYRVSVRDYQVFEWMAVDGPVTWNIGGFGASNRTNTFLATLPAAPVTLIMAHGATSTVLHGNSRKESRKWKTADGQNLFLA